MTEPRIERYLEIHIYTTALAVKGGTLFCIQARLWVLTAQKYTGETLSADCLKLYRRDVGC